MRSPVSTISEMATRPVDILPGLTGIQYGRTSYRVTGWVAMGNGGRGQVKQEIMTAGMRTIYQPMEKEYSALPKCVREDAIPRSLNIADRQ